MPIRLNLLVIRSPDIDRAVAVYEAIGLSLTKHAHGRGPEHHATELDGGAVFEIYPLANDGIVTTATRLGFVVPSVDDAVEAAVAAGATVSVAPKESPWGRRAVIVDLDGHKVELVGAG